MAKRSGLSIKWDKNFTRFMATLGAAASGEMNRAIELGTKRAALYVLGEITRRIKAGDYEKLAAITEAMKEAQGYSSTPLIRRGSLLRSISRELQGIDQAEIGLLLQRKGRGDGDFSNIGVALHEGTTIRVTDAMRRAFARKLAALEGKENLRPGTGKGIIRIPPRPFVADVFNDPAVEKKIQDIYYQAMREHVRIFG